MKKVLLLTISLSLAFVGFAQKVKRPVASAATPKVNETEVLIKELKQYQLRTDSLIGDLKRDIVFSDSLTRATINMNVGVKPRYKMYKTENIHILLKLDTKIGKVYMVQYRMKETKPGVVPIDNRGVVSENEGWVGRYELCPTQNMYTFIMLDTYLGNTYQVQWGTDYDHRFVERIWD